MKNERLKIPTEKGRYYKDIWLELYDGGSDQWLWVCRDSLAYIFLEVQDAVGYEGRGASHLFYASVSVVDLFHMPVSTIGSALQHCGCEDKLDYKKEEDRLRIAEMCHSAGHRAPMFSEYAGKVKDPYYKPDEGHPAFRTLRAKARKYAETELFDDEHRNELMNTTVVNALGETAWETMQGAEGMWAAMRRIKEAGDTATPAQQLMLHVYQKAGTTLGAGPVPRDIMEKNDDGRA